MSYSFRDRDLEHAIAAMVDLHVAACELWQDHVETGDLSRDARRRWRLTVPADYFQAIRAAFDRAHIELTAYNLNVRDDFSDEEMQRGFEMAGWLGVPTITASANQHVVPRVARFAERFRIRAGMHNHSYIDPDEFATPDDLARALAISPWIAANLDIGHFTAANFDATAFLTAHHDRIVSLHLKDRKRNDGPNVPWGQGDTPIKAVLRLLRDNRWPIPANVEYEHDGTDTVAEVGACLRYCDEALTS